MASLVKDVGQPPCCAHAFVTCCRAWRSASQAGVPRAARVEELDQSVAPPGLVGGLLLAAAIVMVFIGALVEAFPHRRRTRVVSGGEGVVSPMVPMPRLRVRYRQAARVAVS